MSAPREDVERYLRRATHGLWGRRRREVREELLSHLEERVLAHRIGGSSEPAAVQRALAELGDPGHVRQGMIRLHSLPTLAGLGAMLIAVCVVTLSLTQESVAQQLSTSFTYPSASCAQLEAGGDPQFESSCTTVRPWVSAAALRDALEPQGVEFSGTDLLLGLRFPGGNPVTLFHKEAWAPDDQGRTLVESQRVPPGHFDTLDVLYRLIEDSGLAVTVQGWEQVDVQVGNVGFKLDLSSDRLPLMLGEPFAPSYNFYASLAYRVVHYNLIAKLPSSTPRVDIGRSSAFGLPTRAQRFEVNARPTDVYAVIVHLDAEALGLHRAPNPVHLALAFDVAPANTDGRVELDVPMTDLTWLDAWPENPVPGTAMLVRLTAPGQVGVYGHEIVPPTNF